MRITSAAVLKFGSNRQDMPCVALPRLRQDRKNVAQIGIENGPMVLVLRSLQHFVWFRKTSARFVKSFLQTAIYRTWTTIMELVKSGVCYAVSVIQASACSEIRRGFCAAPTTTSGRVMEC